MEMYAVVYPEFEKSQNEKDVLAMFKDEEWAEKWKEQYCKTAIIVKDKYYSYDAIRKIEEQAYDAGVNTSLGV